MGFNAFDKWPGAPLGPNATRVGEWQNLQQYAAISAVICGDQLVASARFEWSDDGETVQLSQQWITDQNPLSYGGAMVAASPTQAPFVRLVVVNGPTPQGASWAVQTALLDSVPSGYVSPLVDFPRDGDPGQTTRAILFGRRAGSVDPQYTHVLLDTNGEVVVSEGILPTSGFGQRIPATLESTLVGSFAPENRNSLSIFNSSTAGNMYVRLALDVSVDLNDWDYRVPPGWLWVAPRWGGEIFVAWDDDSDGFGHVQEVFA